MTSVTSTLLPHEQILFFSPFPTLYLWRLWERGRTEAVQFGTA
jgi:hypothetical protein